MSDRPFFVVSAADHVGCAVASREYALPFWVDGLGARSRRTGSMGGDVLRHATGARDAGARFAVASPAGQPIELLDHSGPDRPASPSGPIGPGAAHLALVVDDRPAAIRRIGPHGWRAQGAPRRIEAGTRVGPDGATIELMQPPVPAGQG